MWFSKEIEQIFQELSVDPSSGLSEEEAKTRLDSYGPNKLKRKKQKNIFQLFIAQLKDWLIYVLLAAVVITLFMGEYVDAIIILMVIIINATLGVIQEVKAGKAIEALQRMAAPKALVRRNGVIKEIDSDLVVPGDILILEAGRFIAADIRLIETANLKIDESALTGESVPSEKDAALSHNPDTPLGDRRNSAFMSTAVTYGRGSGVVTDTGMNTEVGKIANFLEGEEEEKTPLEIRLNQLGKTLGKLAIAVCAFIFIISLFQGRELTQMFLIAVSLAVASIPEGLAAIVAVVLSIGVTKMSKKNAIIRRLPAVETLGSVNIVCSDKTGTLTQNKMTVTTYYNLSGELTPEETNKNNVSEDAKILVKAMVLCSDATYENGRGTGDPTEVALLVFGDILGVDRKSLSRNNKRIGENSFDSNRKLMSILNEENGKFTVYTKGAIDNLLRISTRVVTNGQAVPITNEHKTQFLEAAEKMAGQALRTLGAAYKPVNSVINASEMEKDLILIGLVGMIDPPRTEVKSSILKAMNAGVTPVMITGDHKSTAFAIAKDLEIAEKIDEAVTGQEIDSFSDEDFSKKIIDYRVFARVSPEHKVRIVRALKSHGNIVSMTGDGVNDAPSLNAADIGVAMGITGTDVAKSASDMVLADDNFATIVTAIEEGRNIYNNIKKAVIFLLTCNLGEVVAMFVALIIGWEAPLIAIQLLWINLITDTLPAVALGMDPGDPDVMKEKPRNPKENFFAHRAGMRAMQGGAIIGAITILAFWLGYNKHGYSPFDKSVPESIVEYARTMAFITIIACQLFYALAVRNSKKTLFRIGVFSNKYLIGAIVSGLILQSIIIGIPVMRNAFKLEMLEINDWLIAFGLGLTPLVLREIYKLFASAQKKAITEK